jgi:hypothetical protein
MGVLCSGCAQAVLRLCSGCAQVVLRLCSGCAQAVLRLCSGCAQAVLRLCSGCAQAVLRLCFHLLVSSECTAVTWLPPVLLMYAAAGCLLHLLPDGPEQRFLKPQKATCSMARQHSLYSRKSGIGSRS